MRRERRTRTRTSFCVTARSTCADHDPAAVKYLGPAAARPAAARKHPAVPLAGRRPGRPTAERHSCGPVTLCDSYRHAALRYACDPAPRRDSACPAPRRHSTRAPVIALVARRVTKSIRPARNSSNSSGQLALSVPSFRTLIRPCYITQQLLLSPPSRLMVSTVRDRSGSPRFSPTDVPASPRRTPSRPTARTSTRSPRSSPAATTCPRWRWASSRSTP
jgi:hypothetical protein